MATSSESERYLLSVVKRHMATDFQLEVVVDDSTLAIGDSVLAEAHDLVARIENEITEFRESSPVWFLNQAAVGEWVSAPAHLLNLLAISERLMTDSAGLFNVFAKSGKSFGFDSLEVDRAGKRIRRLDPGLHLGFGAIGKGYALDAIRPLLDRHGLSNYRLSSGGSSWIFSGLDPNLRPWKLAWAWKRDEDGDYAGRVLRITGGAPVAIGVSGTLEQGDHLIAPAGNEATRPQSSFYAGRSAAEADALSTALFVGAESKREEILTILENGLREPAMAYVDPEEQMIYNRRFHDRFFAEAT